MDTELNEKSGVAHIESGVREALLYEDADGGKVRCRLCSHYCLISPGKRGICHVRENRGGKLYSLVYGKVIAKHLDPIEKKPLFHFYPGSQSLSISTVGCNFRCLHCQNWEISQFPRLYNTIAGDYLPPEAVVDEAGRRGARSISYTYTEPTIFMEYALDCARLARERGIKNVFVSNGYTSPEGVELISPYLDANNIDIKGDDDFYRKVAGARLEPVLDTVRRMKDLGIWVEVTTLVIPGYNDSEEFLRFMAEFIASVDPAIPWHVTQFYPTYKMTDRGRTPISTLRRARKIGLEIGLKYVYEGNVPGEGGENTYCPGCGEVVIERLAFSHTGIRMKDGKCVNCGCRIDGIGMP
jgi:pyruvate formate lyase activating enzyme